MSAILNSCGSTPSTNPTPTITVSCTPTDVTVLATSQCTASVLNLSSTLVNWTVSGTGNGSINSGGLYTAPATVPTNNVITITATSQVMASLTATQNLTLVQPTAIAAVTCNDTSGIPDLTVSSGNRLSCTATASNGVIVPVNWSVANTSNSNDTVNLGSISAQGNYTAPLVPPSGQQVTITATSQALATDMVSVTATVVFGNAALNSGTFVFSTSGRLPNNAFWARVGSFTAGGGAITGISEDTNQGGTPNLVKTQRAFTGSYSVGPDGRGTMQFCEDTSLSCPLGSLPSAVTAWFRIVVVSPNVAQILEFSPVAPPSANTIAAGEMISQDSLAFPANQNLSGTYSFNFSGVSSSATEQSVVGDFAADGFGHISAGSASAPGETDTTPSVALQPVLLAPTSYSISANGRGTMTLGGLNFSFYPVSASRVKFIEIDPVPPSAVTSSILVGDAFKQQASPTCGWSLNALSGATLLETSGATSGGVVVANVGSFTTSINGTTGMVTAGSLDENSGGTIPPPQIATLTGSYAMDPGGCGRGTLSLGAHSYVFYVISPSNAVLQEITSGIVANGVLAPSQGGPFVNSTLNGSYSLQLAGSNAAGAAGKPVDLIGQLTADGAGKWKSGSLDINNNTATQTGVLQTGMYAADSSPATTLRGTAHLTTTPNLVLYMVSPTLFYVLDVDPSPAGSAVGVLYNQF